MKARQFIIFIVFFIFIFAIHFTFNQRSGFFIVIRHIYLFFLGIYMHVYIKNKNKHFVRKNI